MIEHKIQLSFPFSRSLLRTCVCDFRFKDLSKNTRNGKRKRERKEGGKEGRKGGRKGEREEGKKEEKRKKSLQKLPERQKKSFTKDQ